MAGARDLRDFRESEYNKLQKAGQVFYRYFLTMASTHLLEYGMNFPWNPVGYAANYFFNGTAINFALELNTKEFTGGNKCKNIAREITTAVIIPSIPVFAAFYGVMYVNAVYMVDWQVSENKLLQKFADIMSDPATAKPILGTLAYTIAGVSRKLGLKLWERCLPGDPAKVYQYPNINLLQRAGSYILNLGSSLSEAKMAIYYMNYAGNPLQSNTHVNMALGVSAYLIDKGFQHLVEIPRPLSGNVPMAQRVGRLFHPGGEFEEGLTEASAGRKLYHTGERTAYHLLLAALMVAVYEMTNALDKESHLSNFPRLAIAIGSIAILDYILRYATPVVSVCANSLFARQPRTDETTPLRLQECGVVLEP